MVEPRRKKLNEKELGSLYLTAETPLIVDRLLKKGTYQDTDITALHDSLSSHAPDMAMIALSLAGNMLSESLKQTGHKALVTLGTELKYLSVNTVEEVGRIWVDACRYNVANEQDIDDIINESPDILCMFSSIFMEIAETTTEGPFQTIRAIAAAAMYQAEAHADTARNLLINTTSKPSRTAMDAIPLPHDLQNKTYSDNVVMFSLFGETQTR